MTWQEEYRKELDSISDRVLDEHKDEKVIIQGTSFVDHKCNFCKQKIPSGKGLVRVSQKIYNKYSETPFYISKYYCDMSCKEGTSTKSTVSDSQKSNGNDIQIPEGFEIVN